MEVSVAPRLRRNGRRRAEGGRFHGPVAPYLPGARFRGRDALIASGVFGCAPGAGIDYVHPRDGAWAILVNAEYAEDVARASDARDAERPEAIEYVGAGRVRRDDGHVVEDQRMTGGNYALAETARRGLAVRVVLGPKWIRRRDAYVYAGLYRVEGPAESVDRATGARVFRFRLARAARFHEPGRVPVSALLCPPEPQK